MSQSVCKFYVQGRCKFGENCRFLHSNATSSSGSYFGQQNQGNSYGYGSSNPFQKQRNNPQFDSSYPQSSSKNYFQNSDRSNQSSSYRPFLQDQRRNIGIPPANSIVPDFKPELETARPIWPFSVYSPQKDYPLLISGTDYSPEEIRYQYYLEMATSGSCQNYLNTIQQLSNQMNDKINYIMQHPKEAMDYVEQLKKEQSHSSAQMTTTQTSSTFGSSTFGNGAMFTSQSNPTSSAFITQGIAPTPLSNPSNFNNPVSAFPQAFGSQIQPSLQQPAPVGFSISNSSQQIPPSAATTSFSTSIPIVSSQDGSLTTAFSTPVFTFGQIPEEEPPEHLR